MVAGKKAIYLKPIKKSSILVAKDCRNKEFVFTVALVLLFACGSGGIKKLKPCMKTIYSKNLPIINQNG